MMKRNLVKICSLALSVILTFGSVIPSNAMEPVSDELQNEAAGSDAITEDASGEDNTEDYQKEQSNEQDTVSEEGSGFDENISEDPSESETDEIIPELDTLSEESEEEPAETDPQDDVVIEEETESLLGAYGNYYVQFRVEDPEDLIPDSYQSSINTNNYDGPYDVGFETFATLPAVTTNKLNNPYISFLYWEVKYGESSETTQSNWNTIEIKVPAEGTTSIGGLPYVIITLTPHWYIPTYQVVYHANGGVFDWGDESVTYDVVKGEHFPDVPDPSRDGYWFDMNRYWCVSPNAEGNDRYNANDILDSEALSYAHGDVLDLYAIWESGNPTYKVTFVPNNGGANTYEYVRDDLYAWVPRYIPSLPSSTFKYWSSDNDKHAEEFDFRGTEIDHDLTLYAIYDPWSYEVCVDGNGGTFDGENSYKITVHLDGPIGQIRIPQREGYLFDYWSTSPESGGYGVYDHTWINVYSINDFITSDGTIKIYAHWIARNKYTVTFETEPEFNIPVQQVYEGDLAECPDIVPAPAHMDFQFWTRKDLDYVSEFNFGTTPITADITLVPYLKGHEYNIVYNWPEGKSLFPESAIYPETIRYRMPLGYISDPVREGYSFTGWKAAGDDSATIDSSFTIATDEDYSKFVNNNTVYLYPTFSQNVYWVHFEPNYPEGSTTHGSMLDQAFLVYQQKKLSDCTYGAVGYEFKGWATSPDGDVEYENQQYVEKLSTENETITLYAVWEQAGYKIHYEKNAPRNRSVNGTISDVSLTYNETYNLASEGFTCDGYTLAGWGFYGSNYNYKSYALGETVSQLTTQNGATLTFYALWQPKLYGVEFVANAPEGTTAAGHMDYQQFEFDKKQTLASNEYSITGYTFLGWSKSADGNVQYLDGQEVLNLTETYTPKVTLYGIWRPNRYTVKFNPCAPSGKTVTGEMADMKLTYGTGKELTENNFGIIGYSFFGWATEPGGDVVYEDKAHIENLSETDNAVINLYARWSQNNYYIIFESNAPSGFAASGHMENQEFFYDEARELLTNAYSVPGHSFIGWATEEDGEVVYADNAVVKNLTSDPGVPYHLYAKWRVWNYKIRFNKNDESAQGSMSDMDMTVGQAKNLPEAAFFCRGKTFSGWTTKADGSGNFYNNKDSINVIPDSDNGVVNLYADWLDQGSRAVRFMDGSSVIRIVSVHAGFPVARPEDPLKTGYDFVEWYADPEFKTVFDFTQSINQDTKIYAKFDGYEYNIFFDKNLDAATGTMNPLPMKNGVPKKLTPNSFISERLKFDKWNTQPDGSGTYYNDEDIAEFLETSKTEIVTLYAQWTEKMIVRFETDGGNPVPLQQYVAYGERAKEPVKPLKEGYIFLGWYAENASRPYTFDQKITRDIKLTARWMQGSYTVRFDANGGVGTMEDMESILYGKEVTLPKNTFTKEPFTFLGWSDMRNGLLNYEDEAVIKNLETGFGAVHTLYAVWSYGVNLHYGYDLGFGTDERFVSIENGWPADPDGELSDPQNFDNPGYYFTGWYDEYGDKVDLTDIFDASYKDVYAQYVPVEYNITFHSDLSPDVTAKRTVSAESGDLLNETASLSDVFPEDQAVLEKAESFIEWTSKNDCFDQDDTLGDIITAAGESAIAHKYQGSSLDVDIYASWKNDSSYLIAFVTDQNVEYADEQIFELENLEGLGYGHIEEADEGESIVLTGRELIRKGYTLKGYRYFNGRSTVTLKPDAVLKDLYRDKTVQGTRIALLTADWAPATYKISWNNNGGKVSGAAQSKSYKYETAYELPNMAKNGYRFDGWYLENNFVNQVTVLGKGAKEADGTCGVEYGDAILYAKFVPASCFIIFDKNDGNSDAVVEGSFGPVRLTYGESLSLTQYKAVWKGHKFKNWSFEWYEGDVKKTKSFGATATVKNFAFRDGSVIRCRAIWTEQQYTISYNYNGGKLPAGVVNTKKYVRKTDAEPLLINIPVKAGYDFAGFDISQKGVKDPDNFTAFVTTAEGKWLLTGYGNVTLKAKWTPKVYTVEFYGLKGDLTPAYSAELAFTDKLSAKEIAKAAKSVDDDDAVHSVSGFAKEGGTKASYLLTKDYKMSEVAKTAAAAGNTEVKLYAVKGERVYHISYEGIEGYTLSKNMFTFRTSGKPIALPKAVKTGYIFERWISSEDVLTDDARSVKAAVATDIFLSPKFSSRTYTITINPNGTGISDGMGAVPNKTFKFRDGIKFNYSDGRAVNGEEYELPSNWTRPGYTFEGFAKSKKAGAADVITDLKELTTKAGITLYGVWTPETALITYERRPLVDDNYSYDFKVDTSSYAKELVYAGKAITLKKLSVPGYTFLGWVLTQDPGSEAQLTYDKTGRYVTKIGGKNRADISLQAAFREHSYKFIINPNGGMVRDPVTKHLTEKAVILATYKYSDYTWGYEQPVRSGYEFAGYSQDKAGKKPVSSFGRQHLLAKDNGKYTIYAQWKKVSVTAPLVSAILSEEGTLTINISDKSTGTENLDPNARYVIEYSTDVNFGNNVMIIDLSGDIDGTSRTVFGLKGSVYYVRGRKNLVDSRNVTYSAYSKTARALKQGTLPASP